jgi:DNA excision repair protein ERCC-4
VPARIVVDERERRSGIPDLLRQAGAIIDFAQLKVGDYVVSPNTAIERKTIQDLLNSIYDGRLFVQCSQLNEHYAKPVLIVEGNIVDIMDIPEEQEEDNGELRNLKEEKLASEDEEVGEETLQQYKEVRRHRDAIQDKDVNDNNFDSKTTDQYRRVKALVEKIPLIFEALTRVALEFRIPIIHTPSPEYTSQLLVVMVNKSLQNGQATGPLLKRIRKGNPGYIQQLSILSSLPGVGDKLAVRMLDRFQTPKRALNASAAELARISGFGTERAARVRRILDNTTNQNNNDISQTMEDSNTIQKRIELSKRTLLDELINYNNNDGKNENGDDETKHG